MPPPSTHVLFHNYYYYWIMGERQLLPGEKLLSPATNAQMILLLSLFDMMIP